MTPAGPTDRTSAPSRASRCACVAGVLSHLGGAGRLLLLPRTRRAAERAPRPIDRHMAARCVKRGYRGLAPLRWRREERRPAEHLAASCSWIPRARGEPPGPRHARRPHCPYIERSECVPDRFSPMIETGEHVTAKIFRLRHSLHGLRRLTQTQLLCASFSAAYTFQISKHSFRQRLRPSKKIICKARANTGSPRLGVRRDDVVDADVDGVLQLYGIYKHTPGFPLLRTV